MRLARSVGRSIRWGWIHLSASATPAAVALQIAGAVCVLLWGSLCVRDGVNQGFSARLTSLLSRATSASPVAVLCGCLVAILTQSATATILIAVSLVDAGVLGLATATAVVLGADLGSALASRVLYLDLSLLAPALMVVGFSLHILASRWRLKCLGRISIGLGLMLLGLGWIREAIMPLASAPLPPLWQTILLSAPWLGLIVVAALTWLGHSSVAAVLIIATIDQAGLLPIEVSLPMLLGANIGAGLIALPMVVGASTAARALVFSNLVFKLVLALVLMVSLSAILERGYLDLLLVDQAPGVRLVVTHIGFNVLVVLLFLPLARLVSFSLRRYLEARQQRQEDALTVSIGANLDPALHRDPDRALMAARRETMRLGDAAEVLFAQSLGMFDAGDHADVHRVVALDAEINARNKVVHSYLSALREHVAGSERERELDEILQFSATMEDIGDAVVHDFARLALKRLDRGVTLSPDGQEEIAAIHAEVRELMRNKVDAFLSRSHSGERRANELIASIRKSCQVSISNHRRRLSSSLPASVASSSIHQDMVRDMLQIALLFQHD